MKRPICGDKKWGGKQERNDQKDPEMRAMSEVWRDMELKEGIKEELEERIKEEVGFDI